MAGGKVIYQGEMFESLEAKIDAMTGKLDAMITDLSVHTTKLGEISAGVSQGVSTLNVKSGVTDKTVALSSAIKEITTSVANTFYSHGIGFKAFCSGIVRFDCVLYTDTTISVNLGYAVNGGTAVYPLGANFSQGAVPTPKTFDIPVSAGDSIQIGAMCTTTGKKIYLEAGAGLSYDLIDIVSEGAVTLSGL